MMMDYTTLPRYPQEHLTYQYGDASALSLDTTGMGMQSLGWRESVTQALLQVLGPLFSVILLPTLPFCL